MKRTYPQYVGTLISTIDYKTLIRLQSNGLSETVKNNNEKVKVKKLYRGGRK